MGNAAAKPNEMISEGMKAPTFTLPTDGGGTIDTAALDKKMVIYFYPKDDTPGCTTEAQDFRDNMAAFEKAGFVVIGISKDSVEKHDKFKAKHKLNFTLASDENSDVCEQFGVWVEKNMYGKKYMGIQRATFLVDWRGEVAMVWPKVKVEGHVKEVLQFAQAL